MANAKITPRATDFAQWYQDVVTNAKLASHASVKGTLNYLPNGWAIWTNVIKIFDRLFAKLNVQNVQLPLFIPYHDFVKEKEHLTGFAPELFLVDKKGDEQLSDPLIVRPTSEVLFSQLFQQQIHSYHDLPMKYNQWCSVYRCEKNTKPFLRGSEFFWHELHAMFTDEKSCHKFALQIHNLYNKVLAKYLLLPVLAGKKTEGEKFAGAEITYTREVWSQDQQAIQAGTSHYLGTNFSKMYDVTFQNHTNQQSYPHYMSAGITTRILGCLIVVHGDDRGLVLPFAIAPIQIAILTILADKDASVLGYVKKIKKHLGQYRVKIDDSAQSFGYKISEQEVNGTPFSIVVGPKDVQTDAITLIRRDNQVKQVVKIKELKSVLRQAINDYQTALFNKANQHLHDSITIVSNLKEFVDAIAKHQIALAPWSGSIADEAAIKKQYGVSPRCIKPDAKDLLKNKNCFYTNKPAKMMVYFARAY